MTDCLVIGGGAAGLMAAAACGESGARVLLLERNEKVGRKIAISGKGRCNVTNDTDAEGVLAHVIHGEKFLKSAVRRFPPAQTKELMESLGVKLKTERGGRVFPVSDKAYDIVDALLRNLRKSGAKLRTGVRVMSVEKTERGTYLAADEEGRTYEARCVVVSTGGLSYPLTGSTGDGLVLAKKLGLSVEEPRPGLIPLEIEERLCSELSGLTLKNTRVTAFSISENKTAAETFGELLFTHFGISGPAVLSLSSYLERHARQLGKPINKENYQIFLDLKSALSEDKLDERLRREMDEGGAKQLKTICETLLPKKMIAPFLRAAGVSGEKKGAEVSRAERLSLRKTLKAFPLTPVRTRPIDEAMVTAGGIALSEVDPKSMMVRSLPGLFACGEVLDIDALTGGYNLQCAFATGRAAGLAAAAYALHEAEGKKAEKEVQPVKEGKMLNVAIDGPGGAGKSSVAKEAADRLGLHYLDTGALYRSVGYVLVEKGVDLEDEQAVCAGISSLDVHIEYQEDGQHVFVGEEDLTHVIRTAEVGNYASKVGVYGCVRELLLSVQREAAAKYEVIMDGRDIGTVILPDAAVKFYITASAEERAKRRLLELTEAGKPHGDMARMLEEINERDYRDTHRKIAPLRQAEDAILLDTTDMPLSEVVELVCKVIEEKRK